MMTPGRPKLSVYIADDDKRIRRGLRAMIERNAPDCRVIGDASNGKQAFDELSDHPADLVIADIRMPVMDGVELVRKLRKQNRATRILVLSGYDDYRFVRETMRAGALDYLLKPVDKQALLELLHKARSEISWERGLEEKRAIILNAVEDALIAERERCVVGLLSGGPGQGRAAEAERLGLSRADTLLLVVVRVDNHYDLDGRTLVVRRLSDRGPVRPSILRAVSDASLRDSCVVVEHDELVVLLGLAQGARGAATFDRLTTILESWKSAFTRTRRLTTTVAVGSPFSGLAGVARHFRRAKEAIQHSFYDGMGTVMRVASGSTRWPKVDPSAFSSSIVRIAAAIEALNAGRAANLLDELVGLLRKQAPHPDIARSLMVSLKTKLIGSCPEIEELSESWGGEFHAIDQVVPRVDSLEDLRNYCRSALVAVAQGLSARRKQQKKSLTDLAEQYVRKNLSKRITLASVAEYLRLSPSYFCTLFRQHKGTTFKQYLTDVRIREAARRLGDPRTRVSEVGYAVGYEDLSSFFRAFKRAHGVSPSEYRR